MTFQRQDSLTDQMVTLLHLAQAAGCYDAADWVKARWAHPTNPKPAEAPTAAPGAIDGLCTVTDRRGIRCSRLRGHAQRHRYTERVNPSVHIPVQRDWVRVDRVPLKSGSKTFTLAVGGPCKVSGERGIFTVIAIETHPDGRINVEVTQDRTGHSRVFALDRITYKRPRKTA